MAARPGPRAAASGQGRWQSVVIEVEVLGQDIVAWEDCRYPVVEFRKDMQVDGKTVSRGVVLYAPEAMIAFRTDQVDLASGAVTSRRLMALD